MNSIMMYTVILKYIHLGKVPIYFQQDYCMILRTLCLMVCFKNH